MHLMLKELKKKKKRPKEEKRRVQTVCLKFPVLSKSIGYFLILSLGNT